MQVKMTPKVNMVANSESRIRQLEEEVRALRNQLLEAELQKQLHKDRAPVAVGIIAGDERTNVENDVVGARLQLENDTLKQDKEALARCAQHASYTHRNPHTGALFLWKLVLSSSCVHWDL